MWDHRRSGHASTEWGVALEEHLGKPERTENWNAMNVDKSFKILKDMTCRASGVASKQEERGGKEENQG